MRRPPRANGETLSLVRQALRENPGGMSAMEISVATGIDYTVCVTQLGNFRGAGHVESLGPRHRMTWYLAGSAPVEAACRTPSSAAVAGSIFDPRPTKTPVLMSPGSSRVIAAGKCFVAPDDFSSGAFMADWVRRTAPEDTAT